MASPKRARQALIRASLTPPATGVTAENRVQLCMDEKSPGRILGLNSEKGLYGQRLFAEAQLEEGLGIRLEQDTFIIGQLF